MIGAKGAPAKLAPKKQPKSSVIPGTMVVERRCRIVASTFQKTSWWAVDFIDEPNLPKLTSRFALPCELLEKAEKLAAAKPGRIFRITGENAIYKNTPFLLITKLSVIDEKKVPPVTPPVEAPSSPTEPNAESASPQSILDKLLNDAPDKPIFITPTDPSKVPSVAPVAAGANRTPIVGGLIVNRLVRITPGKPEQWMLSAYFESDNTLQDPPMRLLPCKLIEQFNLNAKPTPGARQRKYRISGEVFNYKGDRYLLPRKLLRERYMGQF